MAQYLLTVLADTTDLASDDEMAAIDVFNDQLQADGRWVFAGGLGSTESAVVVDGRDGEAVVTDGPYAETKEHIAGFWIIDVPDPDIARRLAVEGSRACHRRIELRPFLV